MTEQRFKDGDRFRLPDGEVVYVLKGEGVFCFVPVPPERLEDAGSHHYLVEADGHLVRWEAGGSESTALDLRDLEFVREGKRPEEERASGPDDDQEDNR